MIRGAILRSLVDVMFATFALQSVRMRKKPYSGHGALDGIFYFLFIKKTAVKTIATS